MKKIVSVVVCFFLILGMAGCGTGLTEKHSNPQVLTEAGLYPIVKEEYREDITLTVMGANDSSLDLDWANNKFFKRMENLTGVHLDFEVYGDGMYTDKKGAAFNTASYLPDIFFKGFLTTYDELTFGAQQGQLIPLNDLIEGYAPNIKALLDRYPRVKKSITAADGNIYSLPTIYVDNAAGDVLMRGFWWIDQSWLTELGLEMPTTTDELLTVLRAFKQKCTKQNAYPLVIAGLSEMQRLLSAFGLDGIQYWVQEKTDGSGEIEFVPQQPEFRAALEFFHTLYAEGLINPDWMTYDYSKKFANGTLGDMYGMFYASSPYHVVGANTFKDFVAVDPLTSEVNTEKFWSATDNLEKGTFAITAACEYPELAIRWVDTLYDVESEYWIWAIAGGEGEEWVWDDEEKTSWHLTVPLSSYSEIMSTILIQPGDGMPYAVNEKFYDKCSDELESYIRPQRMQQMRYGRVSYPYVSFNRSDLQDLSDLAADINTCVSRFVAACVRDGVDSGKDTDWNTFTRQFDSMYALGDYMDILQRAYDDFYEGLPA